MRTFSQASFSACFGQKKRRLNEPLRLLLSSHSTERRAARLLHTTRKTVARKLLFLGLRAKKSQENYLREQLSRHPEAHFQEIQFDEMESFEISKGLPLSIPMVISSKTRKILGFRVCSMPAKGLLAAISKKKYGFRKDERTEAAHSLFSELKTYLSKTERIKTDENPRYPNWVRAHFPQATHLQYKGRRGRPIGQGELKVGAHDPLFNFNHSAAMVRANISRLIRKTWCTTKKKENLAFHIAIYIDYHNRVLT